MLSYFIIGATLIIPIIGLVLIARALGTDYKYRDLDTKDEPLVILGQGDYRKDIRPSDLSGQSSKDERIAEEFMDELDKMEAVMEERIRREQEFPLDHD